jgi:hypothetical protein
METNTVMATQGIGFEMWEKILAILKYVWHTWTRNDGTYP